LHPCLIPKLALETTNIFKMFLENDIYLKIILALIPFGISLYFFVQNKEKEAFYTLLISAFGIRLLLISLDPFLHEWDERFHALVAKNMIENPFKPMLKTNPVLPYEYKDWCCNHIWVHKQPLFLWQMALSLKLFGINTIALRLPSLLMGVISVFFIFRISKIWTKDFKVSYFAALLFSLSFYQLELTSGRFSLEHNDLAFTFYVTGSLWMFCEYLNAPGWRKASFIGLFVGAAVLIKWLTALAIFGAWAFALLIDQKRKSNLEYYKHIIVAFLVCCFLFLPWQIYILDRFPIESKITFDLNRRHIFESLDGHTGNIWFHFNFMNTAYGAYMIPLILTGLLFILGNRKIPKIFTWPLLSVVVVFYLFFSFVKTKMPAFTFPASSIIFILISYGFINLVYIVKMALKNKLGSLYQYKYIFYTLCVCLSVYDLKPWQIAEARNEKNNQRNAKIHNTNIYKRIGSILNNSNNLIVINCKSFEDTELMFWQDFNAYHWYPSEAGVLSLKQKGYKLAAFDSHNDQWLPDYINQDTSIVIIKETLK
jgi:4-amino-4-deoxy-L-arabinose transferase-like glycosyltransferase